MEDITLKNWKKIGVTAVAAVFTASMAMGLAGCKPDEPEVPKDTTVEYQDIYDAQLGEFYELYEKASQITSADPDSLAERYAEMAIAEAKLLEASVFAPLTGKGGNYAVSRLVNRTYPYVLWGTDNRKYHQALVANEFIAAADRTHINEMYNTALTAGTSADEFNDSVRAYLTEEGYTIKDSYTFSYNQDPTTWDILATSQAVDSEAIVNTIDGLMEYDEMNELQPALADRHTESEDGLTYTFHIRTDAKWYTRSGEAYASVTADDFVAGFQHMLDAQGGLEYLVDGVIAGASEYINGSAGFEEVGVKQVNASGEEDENGEYVQYTLEQPASYFMTMLAYSIFCPMNRQYFESQGGAFGADYDATASDYTYGKTPDNILYCGPYIATNATAKSTIVFDSYEGYYNYDHINLKKITWLYDDGQNATKSFTDAVAGTTDGTGLTENTLVLAKEQTTTDVHGKSGTYFELFGYTTQVDASAGTAFYNLARVAHANYNDNTKGVSPKSEVEAAISNAAMQNVHFRRALTYAFDRVTWNAARMGAELAANPIINTYTPGTFVQLPAEVTIDINGTEKTYPAGTYYGEIVQDQITADGLPVTVFKEVNGEMSSTGFDGWYNPEEAKKEMALAIEELNGTPLVDVYGNPMMDENGEQIVINISAENPVQVDHVYVSTVTVWNNMGQAYKQSIENVLDEVQFNLVGVSSESDWYYSGYYAPAGKDCNFDIDTTSLWGPDYGDPSTYLGTMTPTGFSVKSLGLF